MEKTKVFIAIPTGGTIRTELAMFLLHIDKDYDTEVSFTYGGEVTHNRNYLTEHFLQIEYEWLLFLDNDIMPPFNILDMTKNGKDICSGVYYQWSDDKLVPVVYRREKDYFKVIKDIDDSNIVEVDGVGAGCLLVNRRVFDKIGKPYFKIEYDDRGYISLGHDLYFCEKTQKAGFKIWIDRKMICNHYKTVNLKAVNEWNNRSMWWK